MNTDTRPHPQPPRYPASPRLPKAGVFIWAVLVVLAILVLNEYGYHHSQQYLAKVERLQKQRRTLNDLRSYILDAETGQRGYLLTGDEQYLAPYREAVRQIDPTLDRLRDFYAAQDQSMAEFARISRPISRKLAEMDLTIKMRQQLPGNDTIWQTALNTDAGMQYMAAVRAGVLALIEDTDKQLAASANGLQRNLLWSRTGVAVTSLLGLFVFYLLLLQLRKLEESALERAKAVRAERDMLEQQVQDRTARLSELTTHVLTVQEDERGRIARDLHDEMGALFTAAKLDTARIKSRLHQLGVKDDMVGERLKHLVEALNAGVAFKRQLIEDLQPSSLKHLGLRATLENYAREFGMRNEVNVETDIEPVALPDGAPLVVFRIVQEALNNVAKYAQARNVKITLHDKDVFALLTVQDDGKGFDVASRSEASHGLPGMRHRVAAQEGRLKIISAPGKGTRIEASLPQSRPDPAGPPAQATAARTLEAEDPCDAASANSPGAAPDATPAHAAPPAQPSAPAAP